MIKRLAYRKGFGKLLAEGAIEAARKIGRGSEYYLCHIKGQPSIEPLRIPKGWTLSVATSPVAGRHLRGSTAGGERFGPHPRNTKIDATGYRHQAFINTWQAKTKEIEDNLGICVYCGTWSGANFMTPANYAELVSAGMGIEVTEERLMNHFAPVGRNLEKAFNTLHTDMRREDDLPPPRFMENPVKTGPYKGEIVDEARYHKMLDEFYDLWGWDRKTGLQTKTCLKNLSLDDVAQKLADERKLIE